MTRDFFQWGYGRRPLVKLCYHLPRNGGRLEAMKDRLLDFLYPDTVTQQSGHGQSFTKSTVEANLMPTYLVEGSVKLRGVLFTIEADTKEEAEAKVEAGEYVEYDVSGAETADWDMKLRTLRENK